MQEKADQESGVGKELKRARENLKMKHFKYKRAIVMPGQTGDPQAAQSFTSEDM